MRTQVDSHLFELCLEIRSVTFGVINVKQLKVYETKSTFYDQTKQVLEMYNVWGMFLHI